MKVSASVIVENLTLSQDGVERSAEILWCERLFVRGHESNKYELHVHIHVSLENSLPLFIVTGKRRVM